ncbi:DUF4129 domain-containing transglutaminase family protein [Bacillus sp. 03113]|uniref:DUF4129 domain-containing transglutaminase family protein n=1 Tax=Bacillus sp. 03113 TaxID=2578211 RepID=UPI00114247F6|nr:DUF4129 domain-containing transglutaminase family protein [Bacillus sp. 03113]
MTGKQKANVNLSVFILYVFGFILIWEWLRPLDELTDTSNMGIFLAFLILSLILSFFHIKFFISGLLKVSFIVYFLHFLYYEGSFLQLNWISSFIEEFLLNFQIMFDTNWPALSPLFRSFLLFILLWLMTYLIEYWFITKRKIFVFFFMTLIYITVLDTYTPYEADGAIVRTVIAGFAALGILTLLRTLEKEGIAKERPFFQKWISLLLSFVALSIVVGFVAPKADPIWPDPVPFIKSYSQNDAANGEQTVGYGTDDSRLGGPFKGDDTIVFTSEVDTEHYWRIESKDIYTGKGWVSSSEGVTRIPFEDRADVPFSLINENAGIVSEEETSNVKKRQEFSYMMYPLGLQQIHAGFNNSFEMEPTTGKIYSLEAYSTVSLNSYSVSYVKPEYSVTTLMETKSAEAYDGQDELVAQYTQLPAKLPSRVKELAMEITADKEDWFSKARAIESYFGNAGFVYDQVNVAIPEDQDDYVDQFLFETKSGYCDNFSSSMVVMLRSLGIPARWVKGYTEGEFITTNSEDRREYEITNNNAHSWVEVYFPNVGWMEFEPTIGFTNNVDLNFDNNEQTQNTNQQEPELPKQQEKPAEQNKNDAVEKDASFSFMNVWTSTRLFLQEHWLGVIASLSVLFLAIFFLYKKKANWLPFYFLWKYKNKKTDENFEKAYLVLLKQMNNYGLKRRKEQTLRDYAQYIDEFFSTNDMGKLTRRYEQFMYKGSLQEGSWIELKQYWENLIKKTIS